MADHINALQSTFGTFAHTFEALNHNLNSDQAFHDASNALGLLTLSHAENHPESIPEKPSWVTNWNLPRRTFLLNHPRSYFHASRSRNLLSSTLHSLSSKDAVQFLGVECDSVKESSQFLPLRRHCDHYSLESYNSIIFDQWFEFAKKHRFRQREFQELDNRVLLEFAETIHGKGCNSIWETDGSDDDTVKATRSFLNYLEDEDATATPSLRIFYAACFPAHGRRFGVTEEGRFCLVPKDTVRGDRICIPHGSRVPFVFRKKGEVYVNLGECYVHGRMNGEAVENSGSMKEQTFNLT